MKDKSRILLMFVHPAFHKSRVNKELIRDLDQTEGITFHDLYEAYPDFDIDVHFEQKLLLDHDIIVFHHPFFWYSIPALLKEWMDLVLLHGWAYGKDGNALRGKKAFNVITTGGREQAYHSEGYNRFTIRELISPIDQTVYLCKMNYLPPFIVHGTHLISDEEIRFHREDYHRILKALINNEFDFAKISKLEKLNKAT